MHLCMKIPRHASKNPVAAGDFKWIFARNCEGTEQLRINRQQGQMDYMIHLALLFVI